MKTKVHALFLTTRPKTLTLGVVPIAVGTVLAAANGISINWMIYLCAMMSALCIQIGTNFMNDALDFKKGTDTSARLGPLRGIQTGALNIGHVYLGGWLSFTLALLFGIPLVLHGGWPLSVLLVVSVILGYAYTGGPLPLAYKGLGDIFVLLFFGLASTVAAYYLQMGSVSTWALLAGTQLGLLAILPLAINNLRDHREDYRANKRTLVVRFGTFFGRCEITFAAFLPYIFNGLWNSAGYPWAAVLPWTSLPIAFILVRKIWMTMPGKEYNVFLAMSGLLHLMFGIMLAIGFII